MTAEPLWISVAGGRLFGVLHRPDVPVRASIILCPPFFHEQVRSQRLFALLADALRGHGFGPRTGNNRGVAGVGAFPAVVGIGVSDRGIVAGRDCAPPASSS